MQSLDLIQNIYWPRIVERRTTLASAHIKNFKNVKKKKKFLRSERFSSHVIYCCLDAGPRALSFTQRSESSCLLLLKCLFSSDQTMMEMSTCWLSFLQFPYLARAVLFTNKSPQQCTQIGRKDQAAAWVNKMGLAYLEWRLASCGP